ncbi:TorF family putative porin [Phenylobacterium sp. 20VBR1]|uniref:Porin n=1 Tax=Phenylobacterium glaciei TaxID=2803784 RepID=A0A941D1S5_9CAUL|nr:TorF family putative porin [Phenylobacterium glaciei]MBR7619271.1 TorF family putative porin [Phenylobacterium glaciei]QQZ51627.1 porin [Phenylobacterium glaciei]
MNILKTTLLAAAATAAMGGSALAADDDIALSFNLGAATDYMFRGVSQTDNGGQIYGGADATLYGIGYAGVWVSNVEFNNGTDLEYDLYAGIKPVAGPVNFDLGVYYYGYSNQPTGSHEDYVEYKAAASTAVGPATVGATVFYSPEFFGKTGKATYYEINGAIPVVDKVSVSGAVGHQEIEGPADYNTWNLGVGYALNDHVGFDLRYHDTDEHSFGDIYDAKVVVGVKASF